MRQQKYNTTFGATTGCVLRLLDNTVMNDDHREVLKGNSWFGSVKSCAEVSEKGREGVFIVKTATALYPKKYVDDKMNACSHTLSYGKSTVYSTYFFLIGNKYNKSVIPKTVRKLLTHDCRITTLH